nr:MAG TPA: Mitochondrial division protein 1 [Caudoviricetes sp.]
MDYSYILIEKALNLLRFLSQSKKHSTSKNTRKPSIFNGFEKQVGAVNRV